MEFEDFFVQLDNWGLTDVLLPFLLIFTILFAIFQKSHILGEGKRNFNVAVSGIIAFMTVIPHVTQPGSRLDVIQYMNAALPKISIVAVAVIMALFLIGLFGGEAKWMGGSLSGWIALVAFGVVVYVFGAEADWWTGIPEKYSWWGSETSSIVIIILVFAIVIWFITREPTQADKAGAFSNSFAKLGDMFKK
jgi:hypothetical protein